MNIRENLPRRSKMWVANGVGFSRIRCHHSSISRAPLLHSSTCRSLWYAPFNFPGYYTGQTHSSKSVYLSVSMVVNTFHSFPSCLLVTCIMFRRLVNMVSESNKPYIYMHGYACCCTAHVWDVTMICYLSVCLTSKVFNCGEQLGFGFWETVSHLGCQNRSFFGASYCHGVRRF